jgi:tape measure domain-containing protein
MAKQLKFSAVLELAAQGFREGARQAATEFADSQKKMADSAETVRTKLNQIKAEANKSVDASGVTGLGARVAEVGEKSTVTAARLREAQNQIAATGDAASKASGGVAGFGGELTRLAAVAVTLTALKTGIEGIVAATVQLQQSQNALSAVTGGTLQADAALKLINKTADELGLRATSLTKDFTQLAAATRGTQLEGAETEKLFTSLSAASATLGLSNETTSRAFNALQQIISKGTVTAEELRGQFAEALPGGMQIAARAFNVTTEQLGKMVEAGIPATQFITKLSTQLGKEFPDASKNAATLGGAINALKNDFDRLQQQLGSGFVGAAVIAVFKDIGESLRAVQELLKGFSKTPEFDALKESAKTVYEQFKQLAAVVADTLGTAFSTFLELLSAVGGVLTDTENQTKEAGTGFDFLLNTVNGLSVALGFIQDGFKALTILLNGVVGAIAGVGADITTLFAAIKLFLTGEFDQELEATKNKLRGLSESFDGKAAKGIEEFSSAGVAALDRVTAASQKLADTKVAPAVEDDLDRITKRAKGVADSSLAAAQSVQAIADAAKTALGVSIGASTTKAIEAFEALVRKADASGVDIAKAFGDALKNANTEKQISAIIDSYVSVSASAKLSGKEQAEALRQVEDAANRVAGSIEGTLGESLKRLGVNTKANLDAQLAQIKSDVDRIRALAAEGSVSATELATAEFNASKQTKEITDRKEGKTLASAKAKEASDKEAEATKANAEAQKVNAAATKQAEEATKKQEEASKAAAAAANSQSSALGQLSQAFSLYAGELNNLSAAAANKFVANLGGDFQIAKEKITDTAGALKQVQSELNTLGGGQLASLGSVNKAFIDLYDSSLRVKEEFFNQKIAFDGAVGALKSATSSSTASVGQLQNAIANANGDFDLLNGSDLSLLSNSIEVARQKIVQLQNQAREAANSFAEMGKGLTQELLRAQGNETEALKLDFERRRNSLEEQAKKFAGDPAVAAEVAKNKELLTQLEQIALKKQQTRDAELRAAAEASKANTQKLNPANDPVTGKEKSSQLNNEVKNAPTLGKGPTQTIEFKAPDGSTVSGEFTADNDATKLVTLLQKAGASSLNRGGG